MSDAPSIGEISLLTVIRPSTFFKLSKDILKAGYRREVAKDTLLFDVLSFTQSKASQFAQGVKKVFFKESELTRMKSEQSRIEKELAALDKKYGDFLNHMKELERTNERLLQERDAVAKKLKELSGQEVAFDDQDAAAGTPKKGAPRKGVFKNIMSKSRTPKRKSKKDSPSGTSPGTEASAPDAN